MRKRGPDKALQIDQVRHWDLYMSCQWRKGVAVTEQDEKEFALRLLYEDRGMPEGTALAMAYDFLQVHCKQLELSSSERDQRI